MRIPKEQIQKTRAQQETDIVQCLKVLSAGGLILYPTDTVWGIGCDATNAEAVKRVYQLKQRDDSKALIVLIDSAEHLDHYVVDVPMIAQELIDVAVKPLTIIYEGAYNLAPNVLGDEDSVGIRVPNDEFCHQLCERFGKPIVSTSANVSGEPTASRRHGPLPTSRPPSPGGLTMSCNTVNRTPASTSRRISFC